MLKHLLGDPNTRKLKRYQPIVEEINFLEEEISKEATVHISKFCVMSRAKPDFAKVIPNACESSLSKPTE